MLDPSRTVDNPPFHSFKAGPLNFVNISFLTLSILLFSFIQVESEELNKARSNHVQRKIESRKDDAKVDAALDHQFAAGRLYACLSSRPGQSGRADGYILEGQELAFYIRKLKK